MRVDDAVAARWDRIKKELAPQTELELKSPGVVDAMQLLQHMEREVERYQRTPKPPGHSVTPAMEARVAAAAMAAAEMVTLNVGGTCFATTRSNLLRFEGSYFATMLNSPLWQPNTRGEYFIDMEPTYFDRIVAYLRTGTLSFDGLASADMREFRRLLDYLLLSFVSTEWDPTYCGTSLQLQMHNLVVVQKGLGWSSVLSTTPSPFFSVRVLAHHHVDIGFTTRAKFEPNKGHELHPGFFFGCERGYAYSEHEKKPFPKQRGKLVVTASFNHAAREISFEVNGQMLNSPFCLVPTDAPLYPIVRLGEREASVEMTGGHWCEDV